MNLNFDAIQKAYDKRGYRLYERLADHDQLWISYLYDATGRAVRNDNGTVSWPDVCESILHHSSTDVARILPTMLEDYLLNIHDEKHSLRYRAIFLCMRLRMPVTRHDQLNEATRKLWYSRNEDSEYSEPEQLIDEEPPTTQLMPPPLHPLVEREEPMKLQLLCEKYGTKPWFALIAKDGQWLDQLYDATVREEPEDVFDDSAEEKITARLEEAIEGRTADQAMRLLPVLLERLAASRRATVLFQPTISILGCLTRVLPPEVADELTAAVEEEIQHRT